MSEQVNYKQLMESSN